MDHGQRAAEQAQAVVARRLRRVYGDAVKEVEEQLRAYGEKFADADAKMRQKLEDGKITRAQYQSWKRAQAFHGKQWRAKRDMLAGTMVDADRLAQRIINGERLNVFAENVNSMAYDLEHGEGVDMGFGYYDSATVARLLAENPDMLPPKKVDQRADSAWYNDRVNNAITRGIIQGKSIPDIAALLARETAETAYKAALRNARTAMTGAQNAGRIEAMQEAQRMGIRVQKRWMCTLDGRTRDAHRDMDGQVRDVDKPFDSDLGRIGYPGDPTAHPGNVWNCRCTLVYVHPEYPSTLPRRDQVTGDLIGDMTYRQWEAWKRGGVDNVHEIRDSLIKAYDYHSLHNGLKRNSAKDSIAFSAKMGNPSQFDTDLSKLDEAGLENIVRAASDLLGRYDTPLSTIRTMTGEEALGNRAFASTAHDYESDTCEIKINPLKCKDTKALVERLGELRSKGYIPKGVPDDKLDEYVFTHEFGHSLIAMNQPLDNNRNWVNADYGKIRSVRREIEKIYDEYTREVGRLDSERKAAEMDFMLNLDMEAAERAKKLQAELDRVKVSTYSLTNSDEFVGESFAAMRFGATESPYAKRCADVLDKYFRR